MQRSIVVKDTKKMKFIINREVHPFQDDSSDEIE